MFEEIIDRLMFEAIAQRVFPGAVLSINYKNEKVYEKSFGHLTYNSIGPKVMLDTLYDLASITKLFTALGIFKLIEQNKLQLTDKINKYIPFYKNRAIGEINIWNLLTHTSGIDIKMSSLIKNQLVSLVELLPDLAIINKTGQNVNYANINTYLLGQIIIYITGQKLNNFISDQILNPLEMFRTYFNPNTINNIAPTQILGDGEVLQGLVNDESARRLGGICGHAGLFSNVYDLTKFLYLWLNGGVYKSKTLFSKQLVNQALTIQADLSQKTGLGWHVDNNKYLGDNFPPNTFFHPAFTGPIVVINNQIRFSLILLVNCTYPHRENIDKKYPFYIKLFDSVFSYIKKL